MSVQNTPAELSIERSGGYLINGADGPVEVPRGKYYFNTKARCRRMMENHLSSEARRVYACLELATMSFQQELAVLMTKEGIRPMRPSDIVEQTGLSKQNVRRALENLEHEGLAERRGADNGPLQKGKVELYSWAVPRGSQGKNGSHAQLPIPYWFPQSWEPLRPLINKLRLEISIEEESVRDYLAEGEEAARVYQEGLAVATRFLERVCARPRINKEEITEITPEVPSSSSDTPLVEEAATTTEMAPQIQNETPTVEPLQNIPAEEPKPEISLSPPERLAHALSFEHMSWDVQAADQLWESCQLIRRDVTVAEIIHAANVKIHQMRGKVGNWIGFLQTAIPKMMASPDWEVVRLMVQRQQEEAKARASDALAVLENPLASEIGKLRAKLLLESIELLQ